MSRPRNPRLCRAKFDLLIEPIRIAARKVGYAVAVHGSLSRDIDLVAIPWTAAAEPAEAVVLAIVEAVSRTNFDGVTQVAGPNVDPTKLRPHGRRCWAIHLGAGVAPYIDLSVMPIEAGA